MNKLIALTIAAIFGGVLASQTAMIMAKPKEDKPHKAPITSPITGEDCKPGWGNGDKNHCHYGPPGQLKKYN